MQLVRFTHTLVFALVLGAPALSYAAGGTKAPAASASTAKKPKSPQPQQPPSPAVRRSVAGPGAPTVAPPPELPPLLAMQEAERELFWPDEVDPPNGGYAVPLLPGGDGPSISSSGLPPAFANPRSEPAPPKVDFVASLRQPDFPVKMTPRVVSYLDYYKNDPRGKSVAATWYRQSGRYEPMLRTILKHHRLPEDLMWVAVVESGLRPTVVSPAGAAGLWQFMPESGKLYGLVIDRWIDERLDPVRSTHAAAMYLQDLYRRFGSWELALASYNMGYGGMLTSIRKYNTNDYWELCRFEAGIPWETTLYVPRIFALAVVGKNPDVFGLTGISRDPPTEFDEVDVVPGASVASVAKAAEVDVADVAQLNPQLLSSRVPPQPPSRAAAGFWTVRVPKGRGAKVAENLTRVRAKEPELVPYTVKNGESLAQIATDRGTTTTELTRYNELLADEVVRPGAILMVPPQRQPAEKVERVVVAVPVIISPPAGHERRFYQVVAGDTLDSVALALAVPPNDLREWNGLDATARLHSGMTLMAVLPTTTFLANVRTLTDDGVRLLVVGSDAFFDYHEAQKGRVRKVTTIQPGDTWKSISTKTGLSLGMLERINRRSRTSPLVEGERFVVYVAATTTL